MRKKFTKLNDELYYRQPVKGRHHFIEVLDLHEHVADHEGLAYCASLFEVDTDMLGEERLRKAARSMGFDEELVKEMLVEVKTSKDIARSLALVAFDYGLRAPLFEHNSNNYRQALSAAREASMKLDDPGMHRAALHRPVNKIGQTALEFMMGDEESMMKALWRGAVEGSKEAPVVLKMYGYENAERVLNGVPEPVPSDPLAYAFGYMEGLSGASMSTEDPAEAYIAGFHRGRAVAEGSRKAPGWIKSNSSAGVSTER